MIVLVVGSWLITRKFSSDTKISTWQNLVETIVTAMQKQIAEITEERANQFLPFIGTLFLFISFSSLLSLFPVFEAPTGSLSTTAALAICVFVAVPFYGVWNNGVKGYLKRYITPSPIMLPFEIIGEFTRTFSLALRLFGNMMSGSLMLGIVISIVPLFVPIILNAFELLIGQIQAYIFAILAMVYIGSAIRAQKSTEENNLNGTKTNSINEERKKNG
jgi:F-type H+-transporting ATPase subunit a